MKSLTYQYVFVAALSWTYKAKVESELFKSVLLKSSTKKVQKETILIRLKLNRFLKSKRKLYYLFVQ